MQYHITAGLGYCQGQRAADPEGCSGNQDGFSTEGHILPDLFSSISGG
jgi:hypothetical protein